jgi:SAM-dependent methyltransferase
MSAAAEAQLLPDIARRAAQPDLEHIDNLPGASVYVRDADEIARRLPAGARVLDWGCGAGHMSWLLKRRGFELMATDVAPAPRVPELLEGIEYRQLTDYVGIPADDDTFDAVLSSGTLEHVWVINRSMDEVRRVLKPGGYFFIFRFPNQRSISEWVARRYGHWAHAIRMSPEELRLLLRIYSFRVDHLGYDSFLPIFLGHRLRSLRPLRARLDRQIRALDQALVHLPGVRRLSTSIQAVGCMNEEYRRERPAEGSDQRSSNGVASGVAGAALLERSATGTTDS